ncbi:MAG: acyl-homoserine-lactone synthase [Acidocella sp.]|nr:acyl-homoserine-lactone synthase [Acidocella sp.]
MSGFQVQIIDNRSQPALMVAMHQLRYRVFKQRLDWEVAVSGGMEIDPFDIVDPVYLAVLDRQENLVGATRLLPTQGPNMLADTFPMLLHGAPMPCGPDIWEVSRLCVDTEAASTLAEGGLRMATHTLVTAIGEWGHAAGVTRFVCATDLYIERILRRAGCRVSRLGAPMRIGKAMSVACNLEVCADAVAETRRAAGFQPGYSIWVEGPQPARRRA